MKPDYKPSSKSPEAGQVYAAQSASSPSAAGAPEADSHTTLKEHDRCINSDDPDTLNLPPYTILEDDNSIQNDLHALIESYNISNLSTIAASVEDHAKKTIQILNLLGVQLQAADKALAVLHLAAEDRRNVHQHLYTARLYAFDTKLHVFFLQYLIKGDRNCAMCTQSYDWNDDNSIYDVEGDHNYTTCTQSHDWNDDDSIYAEKGEGNVRTTDNSGNVCVALQKLFNTATCHSRKAEQHLGLAQYRVTCARDTLTSQASKLAEESAGLKSVLDILQTSEKYIKEAAVQLSGIAHNGVKRTYNSAKRRSRTRKIATLLKTTFLSLVITIILAPFVATLVFFMLIAYVCTKTFMLPKISVSSSATTASGICIKRVGELICGLFFMVLLFPITLALSAVGGITAVFKIHLDIAEALHNRFTTNAAGGITAVFQMHLDTVEALHNGCTINSEHFTTITTHLPSDDTVCTPNPSTSNSVSSLKELKSAIVDVVNIPGSKLAQLIRRKQGGTQPSTPKDENTNECYALFTNEPTPCTY